MGKDESQEDADCCNELALQRYEIVADRRQATDDMIWQTPTLGMTAQSFLMNIALTQNNEAWSKTMASFLSCGVAICCLQLMAKHRFYELLDSSWLQDFESKTKSGLKVDHARMPSTESKSSSDDSNAKPRPESGGRLWTWAINRSSFIWWMTLQGIFLTAASIAFIVNAYLLLKPICGRS